MFLRSILPRSARMVSHASKRTSAAMVQKRGMADVPVFKGPEGPDKRLVLAYSGGLDTSTQLRWLADKGYEVIAFCANLGQGGGMADEDFSGIEAKAIASGAKKCYVLDLQEDFVENYVFPVVSRPRNVVHAGAKPATILVLPSWPAQLLCSKTDVRMCMADPCQCSLRVALPHGNLSCPPLHHQDHGLTAPAANPCPLPCFFSQCPCTACIIACKIDVLGVSSSRRDSLQDRAQAKTIHDCVATAYPGPCSLARVPGSVKRRTRQHEDDTHTQMLKPLCIRRVFALVCGR